MSTHEAEGGPKVAGFEQFEFALTDALIVQLVQVLDAIDPAPLNVENVANIPNGQGVYQLWLGESLEYVGKTDTEAGLTTRLAKHAAKISGRPNLRGKVTYKAVQVLVFTAMELETLLIKYYREQGAPMGWQHSGFGSNDPGRERDTTKYKETHFDARHPINPHETLDTSVNIEASSTFREALNSLKSKLPYNLRFQQSKELNEKIGEDLIIESANDGLVKLLSLLPSGWQATNLPGYLILYKEKKHYEYGRIIARS